MKNHSRIAIVAALEREVGPLIRRWHTCRREHDGRRFRFFEKDDVVLVCGGMGAEADRRATEALIALYAPKQVYSVGFAGALDPALQVGTVLRPERVVNGSDGSSVSVAGGDGVLVSFDGIASPEQKAKLRTAFVAQAVDMEAAAVARAAEARGVGFAAVKVISDDSEFRFPPLERFVDGAGRFLEARFVLFAAVRPWLWPRVIRLARNRRRASRALCDWLQSAILTPPAVAGKDAEVVHHL
jgi:adenosylhomocysteine nucleosidase